MEVLKFFLEMLDWINGDIRTDKLAPNMGTTILYWLSSLSTVLSYRK